MSSVVITKSNQRAQRGLRPLSKRQRVADDLRVLVGTMAPGDRLPSTTALEQRFGVATGTVEAAVRFLRNEGLVESRGGSGTYAAMRRAETGGNGAAPLVPAVSVEPLIAVFAGSTTPFYRDCIEHIVAAAAQQNASVACRFTDHPVSFEEVLAVEARKPFGFVVIGSELAWIAEAVRERGHAVAVIGEPLIGVVPTVPTLYADAEQGGYLAARRLIDAGHTRIAYLHRMNEQELFRKRRWHGHERALQEAGLLPEAAKSRTIGRDLLEAWQQNPNAARAWFSRSDTPTGIVAWSDPAAAMLLSALRQAGIRVPNDVSLIGYDNLPEGQYAFPPLDSVDQHVDVLVRHALFLLSLPVPQATVSTGLVVPTLVKRNSVAAPRLHTISGEPPLSP